MVRLYSNKLRLLAGALVTTALVTTACSKSPVNSTQLRNEANDLIKQGRINEAHIKLQDAASANPKDAQTQYLLAVTFYNQKNYQAAIDHYSQALTIDPNALNVMINLGNCYRELKQPDKAEEWYRKVVAKNASYAQAYINMAELFEGRRDVKGAVKTLQDGLQKSPDNMEILFALASVYEDFQQWDSARATYQQILKSHPDNANAKQLLDKLPKTK